MASLKSLGLHRPSGLHQAIAELLLPEDAQLSSYAWTIEVEASEPANVEDELLTTPSAVFWSRGNIFQKTFNFAAENEPVTHALLARFPVSTDKPKAFKKEDDNDTTTVAAPVAATAATLEKALVVFLTTQSHIYFLSGTSHVIHMPFEVETAFAGPVGVIIQRKAWTENEAPLTLTFPRLPPSSFVSSQPAAFDASQQSSFSINDLDNPKALQIGLRSTLDNMRQSPLEQPQSQWPRLLSLTDPMSDLGLVVTNSRPQKAPSTQRAPLCQPTILSSSEEILHLEQIKMSVTPNPLRDPLILAVTMNHDNGSFTVWSLAYLKQEDPFLRRDRHTKTKVTRRSSMPPVSASGSSTPVQQSLHESFGAPLPGKRRRRSEKAENPMDLVSSLELRDSDGTGATRRSSRRISSMLVRADLSASHDRPNLANSSSKRHDSQGFVRTRKSSSFSRHIKPSLGSLLEAPLDAGLGESLHNLGLEDHYFDALQREVCFSRILSIPIESSNIRFSTSRPACEHFKVFVLAAPTFALDEQQQSQLLVGIEDSLEKRLHLVNLRVKIRKTVAQETVSVSPQDHWKVQNVIDASKLADRDLSVILVLSESADGHRELSLQAPWLELTRLQLPHFQSDNWRSMLSCISAQGGGSDEEAELFGVEGSQIIGIRHSRARGIVDLLDIDGCLHEIKIQLQPSCPQVFRALQVCESVHRDGFGSRLRTAWFQIMQWLASQPHLSSNQEWSAFTLLLFAFYQNLGQREQNLSQTARIPMRSGRTATAPKSSAKKADTWKALESSEAPNGLALPTWMMNAGWQWSLDELFQQQRSRSQRLGYGFIPKHLGLVKLYLSSSEGEAAWGPSGYMHIALAGQREKSHTIAVNMFMALHLLLQDQKLDILTAEYQSPGRASLRLLLAQIARWLRWPSFSSYYELAIQEEIDPKNDAEVVIDPPLPEPQVRPDIFEWIQLRLTGRQSKRYLTLADLFYSNSRHSAAERVDDRRWDAMMPRTMMFKRFFKSLASKPTAVGIVEAIRGCGFTRQVMETLPEALVAPLQDAVHYCQPRPPSAWSSDLLDFVRRDDLSLIAAPDRLPHITPSSVLAPTHIATRDFRRLCQTLDETNVPQDEGENTDRQAVIRALFQEDRRLTEAHDLLSTHKARIVHLEPDPSWTESEYLERQKELVSRIAFGTLAIPPGRALLCYSLRFPLITQKFQVSGFNLNCIVKPFNVAVGVDKTLFTEEKVCWGFFHQGVAAGLAISPQAKGIDTSWIRYNKPGQELSNRHAGFLLALGLNGHLKGVAKWVAFKYLTPKHTMTSVGLLLGLAASYLGTMDSLITRLLSVHVTRMLPRGAAELNLSPLTQTSGVMGIGLLYCGSQHRRMSEIMLSEVEYIDAEDDEEPLRSECYRLTAGFALGLINLGKGNDLKGLHDMRLTDRLITHATAIKDVRFVHVLDRAAAGAVMAVALIFLKSEDQTVARKIDIPDSTLQFDYVRPDILLLRTVAKNLILWSRIEPTFAWIERNLPTPYRERHKLDTVAMLKSTDLAFYSILTGLCFSIALRFSGSASLDALDLMLHYLDHFMHVCRPREGYHAEREPGISYDEELTRSNVRMCLDVVALSCAIIMAGTGNIDVLRRLRSLHGRDGAETSYGSHLAAHLAIGALFLGSGTATFGSSNIAIAALLIAFYPILPTDVMDNRSHLQAFRHFWVLAAEQRCLITKDVLTGQPVSVPVQISMKREASDGSVLHKKTPCLLPPMDDIHYLSTSCEPKFWNIQLDFSDEALRKAFSNSRVLYLRRRPPREEPFTSTLRALGQDDTEQNPLEWLFRLESLADITHAERAILLASTDHAPETLSAVGARLELQRGISEGGDRERLEGARLLFEWAAVRHRLLGPETTPPPPEKPDEKVEWWMADSVINDLKAQLWRATDESGEQ